MDLEALARVRAEFDALVRDVRPQLLRYCARMTGSAVEGEDIVQDALARVYYQLPLLGHVDNLRAWLFRVAHNKSLDYLRRYDVRFGAPLDDELPVHGEEALLEKAELGEWGLSYFARLTALQRSAVILKDVLELSLEEISALLDASVPAVKAALHRGRAALRRLARSGEGELPMPSLDEVQSALLRRYAALFNAHDFDGLRAMLADDVRLEVVDRLRRSGADAVGGYFDNYRRVPDVRLELGSVDARLALLARDTPRATPAYCLFVRFRGETILNIRDYRYARHVFAEAQWARVPPG